jgi:uncharacterized membrane protein YraQ (UPF0718 family)
MFTKPTIAISIALVLALALGTAAPAKAAHAAWVDDIEVATALVCDTRRQVERFVALLHDDAHSALAAINAEENDPDACAEANFAFVRGARLAMVRTHDETFEIVEILIVGIATATGLHAVTPNVYISLFAIDERST